MIFLLGIHLIVPSPHYVPVYPYWTFTWFVFSWGPYDGWVSFIQYAFVGLPAFVLIGLASIIPLAVLILVLLEGKVHSNIVAFFCLVLSIVLTTVYFYGWLDYTWPTPYQPVQTLSIVILTLLAYKNWVDMKSFGRPAPRTANNQPGIMNSRRTVLLEFEAFYVKLQQQVTLQTMPLVSEGVIRSVCGWV